MTYNSTVFNENSIYGSPEGVDADISLQKAFFEKIRFPPLLFFFWIFIVQIFKNSKNLTFLSPKGGVQGKICFDAR